MKTEINYDKPFYLIAEYLLGDLRGFIEIGNDKEEIKKIFEEKYMWKPNTFGITEISHELLEVNAKVIMTDQDYFTKLKEDKNEI